MTTNLKVGDKVRVTKCCFHTTRTCEEFQKKEVEIVEIFQGRYPCPYPFLVKLGDRNRHVISVEPISTEITWETLKKDDWLAFGVNGVSKRRVLARVEDVFFLSKTDNYEHSADGGVWAAKELENTGYSIIQPSPTPEKCKECGK